MLNFWTTKGGGPEGWRPKPRKSGAPKGGGPDRWRPRRVEAQTSKKCGPEGRGPRTVGPKFRAFFPLLPPQFSFFLLSLGGLPVEFWWCLKRRGPQMCTFGVLGLSSASPGGPIVRRRGVQRRRGSSGSAEGSGRVHQKWCTGFGFGDRTTTE